MMARGIKTIVALITFLAAACYGAVWPNPFTTNRDPVSAVRVITNNWRGTNVVIRTNLIVTGSAAIGSNSIAVGASSCAIGAGAAARGNYSVAIGPDAISWGRRSVAIGSWALAWHSGATVISGQEEEDNAVNSAGPNTVTIGAANGVYVESPLYADSGARVTGDLVVTDGNVWLSNAPALGWGTNFASRWGYIDARWYGMSTAAPDNSVALSNALWASIATGVRRVYVPPGTYNFTNAVKFNTCHFELFGAPSRLLSGGTMFYMAGATNLFEFMNCYGMVLRDLRLAGSANAKIAIKIGDGVNYAGEGIKFENILVHDFDYAAWLANFSVMHFEGCQLICARRGVVYCTNHIDTLTFESCNLGYGTNTAVGANASGSVPIVDMRSSCKNLSFRNCEVGNSAPFVYAGMGAIGLTVQDCNFERISYRIPNPQTNLIVLAGPSALTLKSVRVIDSEYTGTVPLIRGIGEFSRTVYWLANVPEVPAAIGTFRYIYHDDAVNEGNFFAIVPCVYKYGTGAYRTNTPVLSYDNTTFARRLVATNLIFTNSAVPAASLEFSATNNGVVIAMVNRGQWTPFLIITTNGQLGVGWDLGGPNYKLYVEGDAGVNIGSKLMSGRVHLWQSPTEAYANIGSAVGIVRPFKGLLLGGLNPVEHTNWPGLLVMYPSNYIGHAWSNLSLAFCAGTNEAAPIRIIARAAILTNGVVLPQLSAIPWADIPLSTTGAGGRTNWAILTRETGELVAVMTNTAGQTVIKPLAP